MAPANPQLTSYLRATFTGGQGSGKSFTSALLALGISVLYGDKAPVVVWDSEKDWEFYKAIFAAEGVPLIHLPERSFLSLTQSFERATREGACVHVADQLAVAWRDLLNSFSDDSGFIGMNRQNQLRSHWDEFVYDWRELPMHAIACGRLGYEFIDYEEDGRMKFAKGDTKMRAGGSESFGYEGSLECEFQRWQEQHPDTTQPRKRRKVLSHICTVLKDRTRVLNGSQFLFRDFSGYKPGDFRRVLREFQPHLEFLKTVSSVAIPRSDSRDLVHTESYWQKFDKERKALLEEWENTMALIAGGRTREAEKLRLLLDEAITGVRSRTRFEQFNLPAMEQCVLTLMRVEERVRSGDTPAKDSDWLTLVELARADMRQTRTEEPAKFKPTPSTLLEIQLERTREMVEARKTSNGGAR